MTGSFSDRRLGDVCEFVKGKKPKLVLDKIQNGAIPYILIESFMNSATRFTDDLSLLRCAPKDIVMVMDGARSGLIAIGMEGVIGSTLAALRPDPAILNSKYLYYWLKTRYDAINSRTRGSAIPHVDRNLLQDFRVPTPSLGAQQRIVSVLERAEALHRTREKANQLTQKITISVFLKLFGDPAKNPLRLEMADVESVCSTIVDGTHATPHYVSEGIPCLSAKNVKRTGIDFDDVKFVSEQEFAFLTKRVRPSPGDVLFSSIGTIGNARVVETDRPFGIIRSITLLRPDTGKVLSKYLEAALNTDFVYRQAMNMARRVSVPDLFQKDIRELIIPLPSLDAQEKFAHLVNQVERVQQQQGVSTVIIEKLFVSLMHNAFSGELAAVRVST